MKGDYTMYKYRKELKSLKPWDEVQTTSVDEKTGYTFFTTAGHGYLCVPRKDKHYSDAIKLCKYGFSGDLACYLEEDCEVPEFLLFLKNDKKAEN